MGICVSYGLLVSLKWRCVQAFMLLSILSSIGAVISSVTYMTKEKARPKFIGVWLFVTCGFALIALVVFTKIKGGIIYTLYSYGWAFTLGWVGAGSALAVGIAAFVINCRSS